LTWTISSQALNSTFANGKSPGSGVSAEAIDVEGVAGVSGVLRGYEGSHTISGTVGEVFCQFPRNVCMADGVGAFDKVCQRFSYHLKQEYGVDSCRTI